nr:hypothetical protein [uncultured bacterium]
MKTLSDYPGTLQHQNLLHSIVSYYEHDPRILAIALFGSLGRGSWDSYSDLDLDIIIADSVQIDVNAELKDLSASFAAINEQAMLIIPDGNEAGDIILKSLMQLSIRYHPLATTSPNIIDSLQLLMGRIDRAIIEVAGLANRPLDDEPLGRLLDRCVCYALGVDIALHRGQVWGGIELLHRMRGLLMELFTRTHQGRRAYHFFEAEADMEIQAWLGATLPQYSLKSVQESLAQFLDILKHHLEPLTAGQVFLTAEQEKVLNGI